MYNKPYALTLYLLLLLLSLRSLLFLLRKLRFGLFFHLNVVECFRVIQMVAGNLEFSRYLTSENFSQGFHISATKRHVRTNFPLHWHEYFEIEIVVSGKAKASFNGRSYALGPGSVYVISPTDFHSIEEIEGEIELINISFDDSIVADSLYYPLIYTSQARYSKLDENSFMIVRQIAERLLYESNAENFLMNRYVTNLLECLLIELIRHTCPTADRYDPKETILKALTFMHAHFREDPSLKRTVAQSGYSVNYFCNAFRRTTGKTYKEYLTALKLEYAKKMLLSSDASVTEVCYSCGFNTLSHFLREFKKYYGATPKEVKRKFSEIL